MAEAKDAEPQFVREALVTPRSALHAIFMAAARIEGRYGDEKQVKALNQVAKDIADSRAEGRNVRPEQKRIEHQRTLFNMLPSSTATDRLKQAMLQRVYDLMWDGDARGADAIAEFLPSAEADGVMDAWFTDFDEQATDTKKSKWHDGRVVA